LLKNPVTDVFAGRSRNRRVPVVPKIALHRIGAELAMREDTERFLASSYDDASKIDYNILSVAALTLALILLVEGMLLCLWD
jgi:hypothetical protein